MTPKERKAVGTYVRWMANELGLRDWTLAVSRDTSDTACYADIDVATQTKEATIRLCVEWTTLSPEIQRRAVIHELLHCHLNRLSNYWEYVAESVGRAVTDPTSKAHSRDMEVAIDAIALEIAKHYPLLGQPKVTKRETTDGQGK